MGSKFVLPISRFAQRQLLFSQAYLFLLLVQCAGLALIRCQWFTALHFPDQHCMTSAFSLMVSSSRRLRLSAYGRMSSGSSSRARFSIITLSVTAASVLICTFRHLLALYQDFCRPQRRLNSYWLLTRPRLLHWLNNLVRRVGVLIVINYLAKTTFTAEPF